MSSANGKSDQIPFETPDNSSQFSTSVTGHSTEDDSISNDPSQLTEGSFGRLSMEDAESSYTESAHWTSILDGVSQSLTLCAHDREAD